jgi:hypothetical protein
VTYCDFNQNQYVNQKEKTLLSHSFQPLKALALCIQDVTKSSWDFSKRAVKSVVGLASVSDSGPSCRISSATGQQPCEVHADVAFRR